MSPICSEISNTMLSQSGGVPTLVSDVATVVVSNQPRLGIAGRDDDDEAAAHVEDLPHLGFGDVAELCDQPEHRGGGQRLLDRVAHAPGRQAPQVVGQGIGAQGLAVALVVVLVQVGHRQLAQGPVHRVAPAQADASAVGRVDLAELVGGIAGAVLLSPLALIWSRRPACG